jgi:hypothetical protein
MDRDTVIELADYLAQIQQNLQESIARDDPIIKAQIAKLALWEKAMREIADSDHLLAEIECWNDMVKQGKCF